MRRFRSSRRALSEIVGSLMLVLIVVAAATTLSIFIAEYQKTAQAEQALNQQRALESIKVLQLAPTLNATAGNYSALNFTVASLYVNPAVVTEISVNNHPLKQYSAFGLNLTTGTDVWATVGPGGTLSLSPREVINVLVDLTAGANFSFYTPGYNLPATDYIQVQIFTALTNDFSRVFIPPTAIAFLSTQETWDGTAFVPEVLMDGTPSFEPSPGNATLVSWTWTVTPGPTTILGEEAIAPFPANTTTAQTITLTVQNSDGLLATDTVHYA